MSIKIDSNHNINDKQLYGGTVFKPVLSNTKSQNEAVFSNLSDIVNDKTPQKTPLHQLKQSLASKPIDENLKRKPATVIVNPKKSSDKMTADDYRQAVWQAVFKKAGYAMLTDGEIRQAVSLMKSVTSSITSSGLDLANMRRSDERLKTLTVKTDEFTIELAKRAGEAVWKGSQNEAEKAAQIKTGGKNEVNQITLDQGRIVWNSAVNTVEGTINTALDAASASGSATVLPPIDPNRPQVDFSSAKTDYQSQMMRRNLEGKLDGDGIKRGQATETAVTIVAPFVIGGAINSTRGVSSVNSIDDLNGLPKGLNNPQVRVWYNEKLKQLNTNVEFTESNARILNNQRNNLKSQARDMMINRSAAAKLEKTDPLRPFEYYVEKYSKQGYTGEALWEKIITGSAKPNAAVNKRFGIK